MGRVNGVDVDARRLGGPYKACLIGWRHTTQVWVYAARKRQLRSLGADGSILRRRVHLRPSVGYRLQFGGELCCGAPTVGPLTWVGFLVDQDFLPVEARNDACSLTRTTTSS